MTGDYRGRKPRVCLISFSPIADDVRVRRHGDALAADGWEVVAAGLPGAKSRPPAWRIIDSLPASAAAPVATAPAEPPLAAEAAEAAFAAPEPEPVAPSGPDATGEPATDAAVPAPPRRQRFSERSLAHKALAFVYWRGLMQPLRFVRRCGSYLYWKGSALLNKAEQAADWVRVLRRAALEPLSRGASDLTSAAKSRVVVPLLHRILPAEMRQMSLAEMLAYAPLLRAHLSRKRAMEIYWSWASMQEMYEKVRDVEADLWIANDWSTLPIISRLIAEKGGVCIYDSHEFATQEYANSAWWRLLTQPVIKAVEASYIHIAKHSYSVSPGISKALNELYRLSPPNEVLRNMPSRTELAFRPTGDQVRLLYHGILSPVRGLEAAVRSVPLWRPEFHLTIRGPGSTAYLASLRKLIREVGVNDRVTIEPPLPMIELVAAAKAFDVGFFALLDDSPQNVYVLPNKFFEYVNAGLALCVSDCPDMAELLKRHDLGVLMKSVGPEDIASAINSLDRETIDRYKRNSIAAAEHLCWEAEQEKLLRACNRVIGRDVAPARTEA